MKVAFFTLFAWVAVFISAAMSSRIPMGHVMPEWPVIVVVFLATRFDTRIATLNALCIGLVVGSKRHDALVGRHPAHDLVRPVNERHERHVLVLELDGHAYRRHADHPG